jgi:hypothetical protein
MPVASQNTVIPWRAVMTPGARPRVTCFCIDPLMHEYLKTRPRGSPLTNPLEQAAFLQLVVLNNVPAAGRHCLCAAWLTAWPERWPGVAVRPRVVLSDYFTTFCRLLGETRVSLGYTGSLFYLTNIICQILSARLLYVVSPLNLPPTRETEECWEMGNHICQIK